jgi:Ser/Thr protein kinase RdoA (MazF antagonist)
VTAAEICAVAAAFGVDVAGARVTALTGGYTNEIWRIDGPDAPAVVRRYGRLHVGTAGIAFEHALLAHVAQRFDAVRAPLRDSAGATFHRTALGAVAVFPWIAGTTGARDAATGAAAARTLARFHRAVRDLHVSDGTRSTRILGILPWLHETFKDFAAANAPLARALPWNDLIVALGAATIRLAPLARALPIVIVHGDPNPENVVSDGGIVHGLIDFDFAQETERVYDVGALLDEFARDGDDAPLALERIAPLVDAYAAEAPLSAEERAAVADAMLRHAAFLTWYVVTRHGERSPGDIGGAPRYADRVREIARLGPQISERVRLPPAR